jgi:hypothetical protein
MRTIYSFIVDSPPIFAYQGHILSLSIIKFAQANPHDIYVHFSKYVTPKVLKIFEDIGVNILIFEPFGDRKYCNKLVQIPALSHLEFGKLVLLDTDAVFVGDVCADTVDDAISGKIVDAYNPSLECLNAIFDLNTHHFNHFPT